jgi:hypothetical protein
MLVIGFRKGREGLTPMTPIVRIETDLVWRWVEEGYGSGVESFRSQELRVKAFSGKAVFVSYKL